MISKMLYEIFEALAEEMGFANKFNQFDRSKTANIDLEAFMNELELNEEQRKKFRDIYGQYQSGEGSFRYQNDTSNDPFEKFNHYSKKYEDWFSKQEKEAESQSKQNNTWDSRGKTEKEKFDYYYQKYYNQYKQQYGGGGNGQKSNYQQYNFSENLYSNEEKKHYQILDLKVGASFEEIKDAYKKGMKKYHPDRFQNDPDKLKHASEISRKLNVAYDYFKKKHNKK